MRCFGAGVLPPCRWPTTATVPAAAAWASVQLDAVAAYGYRYQFGLDPDADKLIADYGYRHQQPDFDGLVNNRQGRSSMASWTSSCSMSQVLALLVLDRDGNRLAVKYASLAR